MSDPEILQMQNDFLERNRERTRWIILDAVGGYEVHCHTKDGVAPPTSYPTKRLAASRLLQLLGIGPVAPQDHPERICVGTVQTNEQDDLKADSKETLCDALHRVADEITCYASGTEHKPNEAAKLMHAAANQLRASRELERDVQLLANVNAILAKDFLAERLAHETDQRHDEERIDALRAEVEALTPKRCTCYVLPPASTTQQETPLVDTYLERVCGGDPCLLSLRMMHFADFARQLERERASALRAKHAVPEGWISVKERMPSEGDAVLVHNETIPRAGPIIARWNGHGWSSKLGTADVTHWMPLPAAPSATGEGK
jgi:hypothetical protein